MDKIKADRKKLRISQFLLSKISGVSRFKISLIECGYKTASPDEEKRMIAALKSVSKSAEKCT